MKKLIMTEPNQQILNQICQLAAKGAQQVAVEQLENMIQTLNKSMEDIEDETNNQPPESTPTQPIPENASAQGESGAVHNN